MPKISICIDVSDLTSATAFYCEGLGCTLVKETPTHHTLSADGTTVHLSLKEAGSVATVTGNHARTYGRHWTPVHLDFDVTDVAGAVERVVSLGGVVEDTKTGDWGDAAFCADPFGNGFCLLHIRQ